MDTFKTVSSRPLPPQSAKRVGDVVVAAVVEEYPFIAGWLSATPGTLLVHKTSVSLEQVETPEGDILDTVYIQVNVGSLKHRSRRRPKDWDKNIPTEAEVEAARAKDEPPPKPKRKYAPRKRKLEQE